MPKKKDTHPVKPAAPKKRVTQSVTQKPAGRKPASKSPTDRDLAAREARYRAVIETSADGFWLCDREGRILEVNDAYVRRSGYSRRKLLGMRVPDLEAKENQAEIFSHTEKVMREGSDIFETLHRAKDGTVWPVEVNASFSPMDGGLFFVHLRDLAARRRSELLLAARSRLAALAEKASMDEVMQATLDEAELLTGSRIGFFHFVDDDQERLTLQAWSTNTLKAMCKASGKGMHYPISQAGVWVDCFHQRKPVVHDDYASLPHRKGMPEGHAPVTRELTLPVIRGGKAKAIIGVGNKTTPYTDDDVAAVTELASLVIDLVEEKRVLEALRVSEERYRTIVHDQLEFIVRYRPGGIVTFINDALCHYTGLRPDDILGRSYYPFMHPDDRDAFVASIEALTPMRPSMIAEARVVLPDGRVTWHRWSHRAFFDDRGQPVEYQCVGRDETELRRSQEALTESEQRLRMLSENLANGMAYQIDSGPDGKGRRFTYISPAVERMHGLKAEDVLQDPMLIYGQMIEEDRAEVAEKEARAFESRTPFDAKARFRLPSGEIRWRRLTSSPRTDAGGHILWDGIEVDITDGRKAAEEIADRNLLLQQIMETTSIGIGIVDTAGRFIHANRCMTELFGCSTEELIGSDYLDHVHPSERSASQESLRSLMDYSVPTVSLVRRYRRKDGTDFYGHLTCNRFYDTRGNRIGLIGAIADISEQTRAENLLRATERKYRNLIETTDTGFVILDDCGRVADANQKYVELTGRSREEVIGHSVLEWTAPHDHARNAEEVRKCVEQGFVRNLELDYVGPSGSITPIEVNATIVREGNSLSILSLCRDITARKKAAIELSESRNHLNTILENVGAAIFMKDTGYRYVYANGKVCEIFGKTRDEIVGHDDKAFFPPESVEEIMRSDRPVIERGERVAREEVALTAADGQPRTYWTVKLPLKDDAGKVTGLLGISTDITERKKAEEKLAHMRDLMQYVISLAQSAIAVHDRDMKYIYVSDQYLKQYKVKETDIIGKHHYDVFPDLPQKWRDVHQRVLAGAVEGKDEDPYVREDGSVDWTRWECRPWYESDGSIGGLIVYTEVITARKRREEAVRASEVRFRTLAGLAPVGIFQTDAQGDCVYVNERWCALTGFTPQEAMGKGWAKAVHPEDLARVFKEWNEGDRERRETSIEYRYLTPSGAVNWVIGTATAMTAEDGTVTGYIGSVEDITERKKSEQALSASERRFRKVFEQAAVGILVVNRARQIIDVNPALIQMLGYEREELVGRHVSEISVPEDEALNLRMLEEAQSNEQSSFTMEKRYVREDGRILHGLLTISLLTHTMDTGEKTEEAIVGIIEDITDRKRVEQALMSSEALYRNLIETTAAVAWEVDCSTLRFDYISPQIEKISGFPPWQWTDFAFWAERIHPEDRERAINFCQSETAKGLDHAFEYRMLTADDRVVWVRDVVSVIREGDRPAKLRGYFIDVTAAKEAEEKIRQSEQFIRGIHDSVDDGIIVVDRQFKILSANQSYCQQVGLPLDRIIGRPCYTITHKGDKPCADAGEECAVMSAFTFGETACILHKHQYPDGSIQYAETRAFPLKDSSGTITAAIEVIHNVTERHLLEAEQLKSQKLEAIGTLAGGIAHDFNNLLQGVFGYVSMAKLAADRPDKVVEMLDQAEKALSLSVNLTTQLLTFAKGGKPIKRKTHIRPVIENATKFALSGSRCNFRLDLAPDLWMADVDEGQIAQVIQNIVLNASEAMPEGGTVEVSAANGGLPGEERCIGIAIKDTGIGIPEAYRSKIFDPYFTTKQKGSGLGLATSYSIVKNHGGSIEVDSVQNQGTTFILTLPACEPAEPVAAAIAAAVQGRISGRRILLMDDEPMVQIVAKNMIEALGHNIEIASHGEEAIGKYEGALAAGHPFDLVILDLTIKGGMGGKETMSRLLQIDPKVKTVVSSGYADDPAMADYRSLGFAGILSKPYNLKDLRACLNELVK